MRITGFLSGRAHFVRRGAPSRHRVLSWCLQDWGEGGAPGANVGEPSLGCKICPLWGVMSALWSIWEGQLTPGALRVLGIDAGTSGSWCYCSRLPDQFMETQNPSPGALLPSPYPILCWCLLHGRCLPCSHQTAMSPCTKPSAEAGAGGRPHGASWLPPPCWISSQ